MRKKLALIYGGTGLEHDVSVLGAKNLKNLINTEKYEVCEVFIDKSGNWYLSAGDECYPTFPVKLSGKSGFLRAGGILTCDVAFPLLHGDGGEDGSIQGALATAGIAFVGEDFSTSALALDKINTKIIAGSLGIPTVDYLPLNDVNDTEKARLR